MDKKGHCAAQIYLRFTTLIVTKVHLQVSQSYCRASRAFLLNATWLANINKPINKW